MSENTTPSDPRVGEIQARLDAATPGPWRAARNEREVNMWVLSEDLMLEANLGYLGNHPEKNAYFIANAPADVAYLLAQLRARDAVIAKLSDWAGRSKTGFYDEAQDDVVQIIRATVAAVKGVGE